MDSNYADSHILGYISSAPPFQLLYNKTCSVVTSNLRMNERPKKNQNETEKSTLELNAVIHQR